MPDIDMSERRYPYVVPKNTPERRKIARHWRQLRRENIHMARIMWRHQETLKEQIIDQILEGASHV